MVSNRTIGVNFKKNFTVGWVERIPPISVEVKENSRFRHAAPMAKTSSETQRFPVRFLGIWRSI